MRLYSPLAASLSLLAYVSAQFPPAPEGVTTIKSKFNDGIKISYKEACCHGRPTCPCRAETNIA